MFPRSYRDRCRMHCPLIFRREMPKIQLGIRTKKSAKRSEMFSPCKPLHFDTWDQDLCDRDSNADSTLRRISMYN